MRSLTFTRVLGSGAFGTVYLADLAGDRGFRRQVAVKVLLSGVPDAEMFVSRVRDEARLLGLLQDEHILEVIELVRIDQRDAVVMEYVEGVDLSVLIERGSLPPPKAIAELGAAVAGALHSAHHARHPETGEHLAVVHRDVKPANVMMTDRGGVKLLDFGVARARFAARESQTGQFVLGTLNYMAPEYVLTGDVDGAADIYGLAVTLWESAAGDVFGQPKLKTEAHLKRLDERMAKLGPGYQPLAPILRDMLAWRPEARPSGRSIEERFFALADSLPGPGLRTWSAEAVRAAIAARPANPKDECGLLGRTLRITPSGAAKAPEDDPPTQWQQASPAGPPPPPPPAAVPPPSKGGDRVTTWEPDPPRSVKAGASVVPATAPADAAIRRRKSPDDRLRIMVIQGIVLGGALAVLFVILVGALFYGRSFLP